MGECITADPSENYDVLKRQFLSLRMLANSQQSEISILKEKYSQECINSALAGSGEIESHRENNAALTEALLLCESQREALRSNIGRFAHQAAASAEREESRRPIRPRVYALMRDGQVQKDDICSQLEIYETLEDAEYANILDCKIKPIYISAVDEGHPQ